ncbi:hypothetical protein NUW58_g774 [Xylaria curta]|uniref:Uncharacterized protein n=1 Tax=Xylaria curta TaxID=42375 RepID=A0ACC1PQ16_9PEZI|nr:hypothetical protein NUW58_g774 [Xylaria curta]
MYSTGPAGSRGVVNDSIINGDLLAHWGLALRPEPDDLVQLGKSPVLAMFAHLAFSIWYGIEISVSLWMLYTNAPVRYGVGSNLKVHA